MQPHPSSSSSLYSRSASPRAQSKQLPQSDEYTRQRHPGHPHPSTPQSYTTNYADYPPADVKDPFLAASSHPSSSNQHSHHPQQAAYASSSSAYSNGGGAHRPRSPLINGSGGDGGDGTLSNLLSTLFRSAKNTFSSSPSSSSSRDPFSTSTSSATGLSNGADSTLPLPIPSPSTLGFILLCILWYLSSAFSSNTGKSILTRFRYPVTLTFVQFAFVAGYSLLILFLRERFAGAGGGGGHDKLRSRRGSMSMATLGGWGVRRPSRHMFHGTLMMSLFQIAGHVFSSMAIARVPVSTVHTIKALSPLFTVLSYALLFNVRYTTSTYIALAPLTLGVMLACSFNIRANAIGFLCALGSTFIFVAQNIFSKKLLPKESKEAGGGGAEGEKHFGGGGGAGAAGGGAGAAKLDKLNLLFYSSGMAFFLMIPIWLYSDASALLFPSTTSLSTPATTDEAPSTLLFYFFLNGSVHFLQNLLAFSLLARTSPVTYSIASLVKRIAVICIAIVWSHQRVNAIQGLGMSMTFGGLWMYNRAKGDVERGEKRRVMVEKRGEMSLPTTLGDVRAMEGTDTPPYPPSLSASLGPGHGPLSPPSSSHHFSNGHPHSHPHQQQHSHVAPPPRSSYDDPYAPILPPTTSSTSAATSHAAGVARNRQSSQGQGVGGVFGAEGGEAAAEGGGAPRSPRMGGGAALGFR